MPGLAVPCLDLEVSSLSFVCIDGAEWTPPFSEATLTQASLSPEEAQVDFCQYAEDSFTVL